MFPILRRLVQSATAAPVLSPSCGPPAGAAAFADAFHSPATVGTSFWARFLGLPIQAF